MLEYLQKLADAVRPLALEITNTTLGEPGASTVTMLATLKQTPDETAKAEGNAGSIPVDIISAAAAAINAAGLVCTGIRVFSAARGRFCLVAHNVMPAPPPAMELQTSAPQDPDAAKVKKATAAEKKGK